MKRLLGLLTLCILSFSVAFQTTIQSASPSSFDTGYISPSGFNNDSGNWQNGSNAFADDDAYATSTFRNNQAGRWYGYNLSIPQDAIITGIEVRVDALGERGVGWYEIEIYNGTTFSSALTGGTNAVPGPLGSNTPLSRVKTSYVVGGPTELWGLSWSVSGANAIQVRVRVVNLNEVHRLYWLPVRIYYNRDIATETATATDTATSTSIPPDTATPVLTETPVVNPTPRRVVIYLEGIKTKLTTAEIDAMKGACSDPANDPAFGHIKVALLNNNFVCDDFLRYSYQGGQINQAGDWEPEPYKCADTGARLRKSVTELKLLIRNYRSVHPNTEFVLIGHSLGGLIAFETATSVGQDPLLPIDAIDSVISIDSPLNYTSQKNLNLIRQTVPGIMSAACQAGSVLFASNAAKDISLLTNSNKQTIRAAREQLVVDAQAFGIRFMTIGNADDCVWYLGHCGIKPGPIHKDWVDDRDTMIIANADFSSLYPLGTRGCDLSGPVFVTQLACLDRPHNIALRHSQVVSDIATFVGVNP